jgi:hypothetical protein
MRVLIAVGKDKVESKENIPWIYVGHNSIKMLSLEKKHIGKRVSLTKEIHEESIRLRPDILKWVDSQKRRNKDSLSWWSTNLGSRVNFTSLFFSNLYQIVAVKNWLLKNENLFSEILIICENLSLATCINRNLRESQVIVNQYSENLVVLSEFINRKKLLLKVLASEINQLIRHSLAAKITRPKFFQYPTGEVYIIHQCLDNNSLLEKDFVNCRYFSSLPEWLEEQGKQVFRLPWFSNVSGELPKYYAKIRAKEAFIPYDWIGFASYIRAIWSGLRSSKSIGTENKFLNFDISELLKLEKSDQIIYGLQTSKFWLLEKALKRFLRDVEKLVLIQFFENHPPEHFLISFSREKLDKRVTAIGYYHSIVSKDYLAYHFLNNAWDSHIFPDIIVTNGDLAKGLLMQQGLPSNRLIVGPGLRKKTTYSINLDDEFSEKGLLVLLPIYIDAASELLEAVSSLANWIEYSLRIKVFVKPHPMMNCEHILNSLRWKCLPKNWLWEKKELSSCLQKVRCAITVSSASIIDVVLGGCIPISFSRSLDIPRNYLDILSDSNKCFEPVCRNNLKERLENIFLHEKEKYSNEANLAKLILENGINPVNDTLLKNFIV